MRQLSSLCAKLELVNYAETKRVKALMKDLQQKGAAISEPDTQVTSMMIEKMYGSKEAGAGTLEMSC